MWRCLLLLLVCAWSSATPPSPRFQLHVSTRKVTCLGERWIGTTGGCRDYRGGPVQLPGAVVHGAEGDWLATDRGLFYAMRLVDGAPTWCVLETPSGLVTGHARGEVKFWQDNHAVACPTSAPIHSLVWDNSCLWAASCEGVWKIQGEGAVPALKGTVTSLVRTPEALLAGTAAGVYRNAGGDWVRVGDGVLDVTCLAWGGDRLWVGTAAQGVFRGSLQTGMEPLPGSPMHISALRWTAEGLVIGTPDGAYRDGAALYSTRDEIADNVVTAVAAHAGKRWVGTFEDGLSEGESGQGWHTLQQGWVNQLAWNGDGLCVRFSDGSVQCGGRVLGKTDGLLKAWTSSLGPGCIGTLSGFTLYGSGRWRSYAPKPRLQGVTVTCVLPEGSDRVWLGSQSGLWEVKRQTGATRQILAELSDSWVTALADWQGQVCVGTFRGGLCVGRGARWQRWDGLPGDRVHCLLSTARGLWIGTPEGLVWTDLRRVRVYTMRDGLPGNVVWSLAADGDTLLIGTQAGLAECRQTDLVP